MSQVPRDNTWLKKVERRIPRADLKPHLGDVKFIERFWEVPLDYEQEGGEKIKLFGRTAIPVAKERDNLPTSISPPGESWNKKKADLSSSL